MVLNGETIVLQAQSIIDHVHQASVPDPALSDKFPDHLTGTYVVFWSMLDTAALDDNGDWLVRTLKEAEVEALKEVAHALSQVISLVVVLLPDSSQMNFIGEAARRWDLNIDLFVRELIECGILFVQPHSLEKLEYDKHKYAFATAHNTEVIMKIFRWILCVLDAYTQLRSYRLEC